MTVAAAIRAGADDELIGRLLGRDVVDPLAGGLGAFVGGTRAVVTGAGGSIGREVCRLLARLGASEIVLAEAAEGPLMDVATMLRYEEGFERTVPILADLRRPRRAVAILRSHPPELVVHTAAYKHVPLAETHVLEAVANNVVVTRRLVEAAVAAGVPRLVALSTDKAVRPVNVLGMTKAVGEAVVRASAPPGAAYASIRLGNVLTSVGSVVPLMRRQIEHGGPVTITHMDATRYLVTPAEAAGLAVAAGAIGSSGEIVGLDLGAPVRVVDVAHEVIRTEARSTGRLVGIAVVGLRPGEKLHEQLWDPGVRPERTRHPRILRTPAAAPEARLLAHRLDRLEALVEEEDADGVRVALRELADAVAARPAEPRLADAAAS
jgi:FlaA1/EpsC-like NDP-sugar epimerase